MGEIVVIGLGANLGDRLANLRRAADWVGRAAEVEVLARSSVVETPPLGGPAQPDYLNAALSLRCGCSCQELLTMTLGIERRLGRRRPDRIRWGPRSIDIDLLWTDGEPVAGPRLRIPHPRLCERPFALQPLLEVVPTAADPATGRRYATLPAASVALRTIGPL